MNNVEIKVFSAEWCSPCKAYKPLIDSLIDKGYNISKYNIDESVDEALNYNVRSIPTIVVLNNDVVVATLHGVQTEDTLLEFFN